MSGVFKQCVAMVVVRGTNDFSPFIIIKMSYSKKNKFDIDPIKNCIERLKRRSLINKSNANVYSGP